MWQTDNRQQTDRQQTDRQKTDIFELTHIHLGNFNFFFFIWKGNNKWGEIYTTLLTMQVCFAHLLCSQGDKISGCDNVWLLSVINSKHTYFSIIHTAQCPAVRKCFSVIRVAPHWCFQALLSKKPILAIQGQCPRIFLSRKQ